MSMSKVRINMSVVLNFKSCKILSIFFVFICAGAIFASDASKTGVGDVRWMLKDYDQANLRAPMPGLDPEIIIDQIIELEESALALRKDIAAGYALDKENIEKIINKSLGYEKLLSDITSKYGENDIDIIYCEVLDNVKIFSPKIIVEKEQHVLKIKFFLGRSKYTSIYDPVAVFKSMILDHIVAVSLGDSPCTDPEKFQTFSVREKWMAQLSIDQMDLLEKQLLLLYELVPMETIQELNEFLTLPSLAVYLQGYKLFFQKKTPELTTKFLEPIDRSQINSHNILQSWIRPLTRFECRRMDGGKRRKASVTSPNFIQLNREFSKSIEEVVHAHRKNKEREKQKRQKAKKQAKDVAEPKAELSAPMDLWVKEAVVPAKESVPVLCESKEELPTRTRYVPEAPKGQMHKQKMAAMIEEISSQKSDPKSLVKPAPFTKHLNGVSARAYQKLFKLGSEGNPLDWTDFETLFRELKGQIISQKGNGSSRGLNYSFRATDGSLVSSNRFIHEPHAAFGGVFGYESLKLLRAHFTFWGLAPDQGNVILD